MKLYRYIQITIHYIIVLCNIRMYTCNGKKSQVFKVDNFWISTKLLKPLDDGRRSAKQKWVHYRAAMKALYYSYAFVRSIVKPSGLVAAGSFFFNYYIYMTYEECLCYLLALAYTARRTSKEWIRLTTNLHRVQEAPAAITLISYIIISNVFVGTSTSADVARRVVGKLRL